MRRAAIVLAGWCAACGGSVRSAPSPVAAPDLHASAVSRALRTIVPTEGAVDSARVLRALSPDLVITLQDGRTIEGIDAARAAFAQSKLDIGKLALLPGRLLECESGVYEFAGSMTMSASDGSDVTAALAAYWTGTDEHPVVSRLTIGSRGNREPNRGTCNPRPERELADRRLTASVTMPSPPDMHAISWSSWGVTRNYASELGRRGWKAPGAYQNYPDLRLPLSHDAPALHVRYRLSRRWAIESGLTRSEFGTGGFNAGDSSNITMNYNVKAFSTLVVARYRDLFIGAGPSLVRDRVRLRDDEWTPTPTGQPSDLRGPQRTNLYHGRTAAGLALRGGWTQAFTSYLFGELWAGALVAPGHKVPATAKFPAVSVGRSSAVAGMSIGFGIW